MNAARLLRRRWLPLGGIAGETARETVGGTARETVRETACNDEGPP